MHDPWTIVALGAAVYLLRLAGLVLPPSRVPARWTRIVATLPIALLAALVASSRAGLASGEPARIGALLVAGVIVWRGRQMWAALAGGLAVFWLLGLAGGGG